MILTKTRLKQTNVTPKMILKSNLIQLNYLGHLVAFEIKQNRRALKAPKKILNLHLGNSCRL